MNSDRGLVTRLRWSRAYLAHRALGSVPCATFLFVFKAGTWYYMPVILAWKRQRQEKLVIETGSLVEWMNDYSNVFIMVFWKFKVNQVCFMPSLGLFLFFFFSCIC